MESRQFLLQHYVKKLYHTCLLPMKFVGLARFDIEDGQIVKKSVSSILHSLFILLLIDICGVYLLYKLAWESEYLFETEKVIVWDFSIFHTCVLINMSFLNRGSCAQFINKAIDIDDFLGVANTKFMRHIITNTYITLTSFAFFMHLVAIIIVAITYTVEYDSVIVGSLFFMFLYCIYYDLSLFLSLFTFMTLRVRYLNIAIMKRSNMKIEHLPEQYPFIPLFWNKKLDKMVDFHKRANTEKIIKAFKMISEQLRCLENCYRFTIFMCLSYLILGTFVTVQNFIIYFKSMDMDPLRVSTMVGWCLQSWLFQIALSQQTDMFLRQINQTYLICTYIQLKPTYPDEIYKLTGSVISALDARDFRFSIYGLFYFNTGLLLGIGASLLVYIMMQLQIAFPKITRVAVVANITNNVVM